jgi:hypothetical protein
MNDIVFSPTSEAIQQLEALYGKFDLRADGSGPTQGWEGRNLREYSLERRLRFFWAPGSYLTKIRINKRMAGAITQVLGEINARWDPRLAEKENLDVFVRSYCFGCDSGPNPFWYGAGWRLSQLVTGVALEETIKIFTRHGFTWAGATEKRLPRDFYYL